MKFRKPLVIIAAAMVSLALTACGTSASSSAHQDAVTAFNSASDACTSANQQLAAAITQAQNDAKTDPSTMQDPTLIDKLNQAITTAQAAKTCAAPTMASDTATIQQQTTQMGTDTQAVTAAASTLTSAGQAVPASVAAKQQAAAQAQASASAAAQANLAQLSNTMTDVVADNNGYKADISVNCTDWIKGSESAAVQLAWKDAGGTGSMPIQTGTTETGGSSFDVTDPATAAYAICNLTATNGSPGYHLTQWGNGSPIVSLDYTYFPPSQPFGGACVVYNNATNCFTMTLQSIDFRMNITGDKWGPTPFALVAAQAFGPNSPNGDPHLTNFQLYIPRIVESADPVYLTINPSW